MSNTTAGTTAVMSKLSDLQLQHKYDHFLADFQTMTSFSDRIVQVKKIAMSWIAISMTGGCWVANIMYKIMEEKPHSHGKSSKNTLSQ